MVELRRKEAVAATGSHEQQELQRSGHVHTCAQRRRPSQIDSRHSANERQKTRAHFALCVPARLLRPSLAALILTANLESQNRVACRTAHAPRAPASVHVHVHACASV